MGYVFWVSVTLAVVSLVAIGVDKYLAERKHAHYWRGMMEVIEDEQEDMNDDAVKGALRKGELAKLRGIRDHAENN